MNTAYILFLTQIPYYVVLFFAIREIRNIRNSKQLKNYVIEI